jgi:hypothetical protein
LNFDSAAILLDEFARVVGKTSGDAIAVGCIDRVTQQPHAPIVRGHALAPFYFLVKHSRKTGKKQRLQWRVSSRAINNWRNRGAAIHGLNQVNGFDFEA